MSLASALPPAITATFDDLPEAIRARYGGLVTSVNLVFGPPYQELQERQPGLRPALRHDSTSPPAPLTPANARGYAVTGAGTTPSCCIMCIMSMYSRSR